MNHHDGELSMESCEKIHKSHALKSDMNNIVAEVNDSTMSEEVLEDIVKTSWKHIGIYAQSVYRTYKYGYFGKTMTTYPTFFEWILKKRADKSFIDYNEVNEQDTFLLDNYKTGVNHNLKHLRPLPMSSSPNSKVSPAPSETSLDTKSPTESIVRKECPTPCVRELICPKHPPCPPESLDGSSSGVGGSGGSGGFGGVSGSGRHGDKPLRDPDNVQLQCTTRNITFKLKCSKLPPGCDHPEGTYECEIVNEGKYVDSKDLEACDLKCREIHAIHSGHNIVITEATEDAQGPIILKNLDYKKKESKPPRKVTTTMCSKNGVNFSMRCGTMTSKPDYTSDSRFIYDTRERNSSSGEIFSIPLKYKEIYNLIDDPFIDNVDSNDNIRLLINQQHRDNHIDENDECPVNLVKENEKNQKLYNCEEKKAPASILCHNINNINKETMSSKIQVTLKTKDSNSDLEEDVTCPTDGECSTVTERLQCAFKVNHNKTMQILKLATNDLLCKLYKKNTCHCWERPNNRFECLDAAIESYDRLMETMCLTTKTICKFTRETIDGLFFMVPQNEPESEDPPTCRVRKTSVRSSSEDLMTVIKESATEIINGTVNQNMFEDEQPSPNQLEYKAIKNSVRKFFNTIKKISDEEFDTIKTLYSIKETCVNLFDKTIVDSPGDNEPSTGQGYVKEVTSGVIIFQDENRTKTGLEEDLLAQNLTESLHSILSSLRTTLGESGLADSFESSLDQEEKYSESKESFSVNSTFALLKDKIYSLFHND